VRGRGRNDGLLDDLHCVLVLFLANFCKLLARQLNCIE